MAISEPLRKELRSMRDIRFIEYSSMETHSYETSVKRVPSQQIQGPPFFIRYLPYHFDTKNIGALMNALLPEQQQTTFVLVTQQNGNAKVFIQDGGNDQLIPCLNNRVLFDESGLWVADTVQAKAFLLSLELPLLEVMISRPCVKTFLSPPRGTLPSLAEEPHLSAGYPK